MRQAALATLLLLAFINQSSAKKVSLCDAQENVDEGVTVTVSGKIDEIDGSILVLDGINKDSSCFLMVELVKSIPRQCKVGSLATVTGTTIESEMIDFYNDLHRASVTCP